MKTRQIHTERSTKEVFTAGGGLKLLGQAIAVSRLEEALKKEVGPWSGRGLSDLEIVAAYLGLVARGKSDFEAVENERSDPFFAAALGIERVASSARLRQRMDEKAEGYARALDEAGIRFLEEVQAPVGALWTGHVALDIDLFPLDNSGTKKEGVSRTYQGFDGYGVLGAYLGSEGWCLATVLKPGSENGQLGLGLALDWVLPYARRLTKGPLLLRLDSGHDALENRARAEKEEVEFVIKWNPRRESAEQWLKEAEAMGHWVRWERPRAGKRVATFSVFVTRRWQGREYTHRRVMRVVERTIDRHGQRLLLPEVKMAGWWTSLELPDREIIALYADHATSEQYHSEFKSDLDLERLPSGKLDTNALVMVAGTFVYNVLRWMGLEGLMGKDSPVRHPAKRRRLRTVMQELIAVAGKFYERGRRLWLRLSAHCPAFAAFQRIERRLAAASG